MRPVAMMQQCNTKDMVTEQDTPGSDKHLRWRSILVHGMAFH